MSQYTTLLPEAPFFPSVDQYHHHQEEDSLPKVTTTYQQPWPVQSRKAAFAAAARGLQDLLLCP